MSAAPVWRPSPNFGPRRDGGRPEIIVIHYTAMASATGAIDWLCNPEAEVSAHYLIDARGAVTQMVREADRAWHAGAGRWRGRADVNSWSLGIELSNTGKEPFAEPQMAALEGLLTGMMARHGIAPENVIGHSDLAPGRKVDPGRRFDWARLARQGLAQAAARSSAIPTDPFRVLASRAGYTAEVDDETLLAALRLRHCPWNDGPLNKTDLAILAALAGS
ncbi:N-acetylmuramoyl-L-alanine amidase [Poseidonocella sedimentorum]|uniref:N-acetylmuramoyl-L-alanine amidase n=1 Tax=Poseidonocella sedimentorum TaxID=871652 RepID=A0A1I6EC30_9RHOB|nr:N-acetylmuramoyl-L-alanine amidase [Poseidonocella sedimentorum]SFR15265.1 N-acetylmuramoyl-L-alanine amidase [Poseidonocella sedimentorum]